MTVAVALASLASSASAAEPPPLAVAVEQCRGLLPGFVGAPVDFSERAEAGTEADPALVVLEWSADASDAETGAGYLRCYFLPPDEAGGAWQFLVVESSEYGTLTRYDIRQLYKLLRLRPDDAARVKVDTSAPLMPYLYALQQAINGLSLGALYALIAVGFTLIYASGRFVNFAFGQIFMLGAFTALIGYALAQGAGTAGLLAGAILAPVATVASAGALGWIMQRTIFSKLAVGGILPPLVAAIGLSIMLQEAARLLQGPRTEWFPAREGGSWRLVEGAGFDVYLSWGHLAIAAATATIAFLLWRIGKTTRIGIAFRAATKDPRMAALIGCDVNWLMGFVFALGAALAGIAGGFAAWHYGPVYFYMGTAMGFKALTGAIIGGMGSVPGAFLGGVVVALVETAAAATIGGAWRDIAVFGLLVLFLVFRPRGLLGGAVDPFERERR